MKKFLVFLVSLVVVVCAGLTTYYFMRNNEIITIKTKEIYCNAGDTIPLESLGIDIKKANISKKTTFDYNAGGEDVTKYIKYDETSASYVVSNENAGEITLIIRTSNKKYADFKINVHIGNGSQEYPYYIFNEADLLKIGATYRLDKSYKLMNNISLTSAFKPLGYNGVTQTWDGFNGTFDGQNYTVSGMNVANVESQNIGFFSSLGANASVKNLTLKNFEIAGAYANAGILAGVSSAQIEKVAILNSKINNTQDGSINGAFVGTQNGNSIKVSYVDNVQINLGAEESLTPNAIAGGFVGKLNKGTTQATYANNVSITSAEIANAGGYVGEFEIGTDIGSIQQSYANTTCSANNFGAFVGKITETNDFDQENSNMLRHLIGNFAVVYGVENALNIEDADLVKVYNENYFKNESTGNGVFHNVDAALYMVRGFAGVSDVIATNEFIYYATDIENITLWDNEFVWLTSINALPTLKMGSIYPSDPSGEYFRKDLTKTDVKEEGFLNIFKTDVENKNFSLLEDVDLTSGWTPVAISNTTFDGNGKTIRINLNKSNSASVNGNSENCLGLFTLVNNSTIKNLNIVVTGVSANATIAGGLAGAVMSTDGMANSTIENVHVVYEDNFLTPAIQVFGGLVGGAQNTVITNCSVTGLKINSNAQITDAAGLVGVLESAQLVNCSVDATVIASNNVAGVVVGNKGTIANVTGEVKVKFNKTTANALVGGVVAQNFADAVINNANINVKVVVENAGSNLQVGGVSAINAGEILNSKITGDGIQVTTESNEIIYIGGVVATNNGKIENVNNDLITVGSYIHNKNHYVGGVAYTNNATISKVLMQANLEGNRVAGVVVTMNNSNATIDQVAVGNKASTLSRNNLRGDKYIAGVAVEFKNGKMTNLQLSSKIVGEDNNARSSLIVLVFPNGAVLTQATVNSEFSGYGERYRETWTDFASYSNKAEFGLTGGETGDSSFNLYSNNTHHGRMQSVVINTSNAGVSGAKAAVCGGFAWMPDYQDTSDSSFIKTVNGFNDVSQFQGDFTFNVGESSMTGWWDYNITRTLSFNISTSGGIWRSNSGISLTFIDNIA